MNKNNYAGKFEMSDGSESNQYLHYRYSEAPFGYRPADLDDIPNKKIIVENIKKIIMRYKNETNRKLIDEIIEDINKLL